MNTIPRIKKTVLLSSVLLIIYSQLSAWPVDILPEGSYPIASTNFEVSLPAVGSIEDYMKGTFISGQPRYIASLITHPLSALSINVAVPDIPSFYGSYAGTSIPVTGYLIYPTSETNDRPDYVFPYTNTGDNVFPHMQGSEETPIPTYENRKLPLIVYSHGFTAHGLWDLRHMKYLASHGYIALSIFHGDNRISGIPYQLRPLMVKAFLDFLLENPLYAPMIDEDRIGISGSSLGGTTALEILGGHYLNNPDSVTDPRIKAGFGIVPYMGAPYAFPFLADYSALQNVYAPFMAVYGERDTSAPPERVLAGLQQLSGPALAFLLQGEQHLFTDLAWQDTQTLEILFFDSYLKDSSTARQILLGVTYVYGGVPDYKALQRIPGLEPIPEPEPVE
jgi:dienelactone hydrolase